MRETAVKIDGLVKNFSLPHEKEDSVKTSLINFGKKSKNSTHRALRGVSFEVMKGEFFGIVGRNGSGKSTLLKIIAGIYTPDGGVISTNGKIVPFIELGVGFNPKLSGRDNVFLNGAMLGMKRSYIQQNYSKIVEFAELEEFMDQKLKNYSSGMQVRLAFACATFAKADILIVDEVLAVGDTAFQRKCFDHFRKLKDEGQTVIFVSHNMESIREFCDRAVLIESGKITMSGPAEDITEGYAKLFQKEKGEKASQLGNQTVQILDLNVDKGKLTEKNKYVNVRVRVIARKSINNLRVGYSIANVDSADTLVGTNSTLINADIPSLNEGEEIVLVWSIKNIFKSGTYSFVATAETTSDVLCDRRVLREAFIVEAEPRTPYLVLADTNLSIEGGLNE